MKNILIYGLKNSGLAVIEALINENNIFIYDDDKRNLENVYNSYKREVNIFKNFDETNLKQIDLIVISPAISIYKKEIIFAQNLGIKVIGEMELGYLMGIQPKISVTGSNGKSTLVKMIEYTFKVAGKNAKAVGNIGVPISNFFSDGERNLINEVSSFQLESINTYRSPISVILNVTPNHLDRHLTFNNYLNSKLRLINNANDTDIKILNYDDENLKKIKLKNTYFFSLKDKVKGAYLDRNNFLCLNIKKKIIILKKEELSLKGEHNILNCLACILVCYFSGIKVKYIKRALRTFKGLEHRQKVVFEYKGVKFIDDSKSTSIDSCLTALKVFKEPIILLLGGKDKNLDYTEMFEKMPKNMKKIIIFGETANKMERNIVDSKTTIEYKKVNKLIDAINEAINSASNSDVVLLSPATSSFDEFSCFEERGKYFENKVKEIIKNNEKNQI